MHLARFPRIRLAHLPTPLEPLPRLSAALGGPEIWIKRDDCTGLSTGGNKTRKLEFLMAEAQAQGADVVMTLGATQSNHVRQTAAFAAKLGLRCHVLLEDRTGSTDPTYSQNGNVLLDHLHGATIVPRAAGLDMHAEMAAHADTLRAQGQTVYEIPGGGSNPTGALGYVDCAFELLAQANQRGLVIDHIVHATGSAGTQAGLVAGLAAMHAGIALLGVSVSAAQAPQEDKVYEIACATAEKLGCAGVVERAQVQVNDAYVGEGYGIPAASTLEAIKLFAELEGILLDPVYSGKAAAGVIDLARRGHFKQGERVVLLHTGGSVALFAYLSTFTAQRDGQSAPSA